MAKKEIWLPKSETHVTVDAEGTVSLWDTMVMELKPLKGGKTGFDQKKDDGSQA